MAFKEDSVGRRGGFACSIASLASLRGLRPIEIEPNVCVNSANVGNLRRYVQRVLSGTVSRVSGKCKSGTVMVLGGSGDMAIVSGKQNVPANVRPAGGGSNIRVIFARLRANKGFSGGGCGASKKLRKMNTTIIGTLSGQLRIYMGRGRGMCEREFRCTLSGRLGGIVPKAPMAPLRVVKASGRAKAGMAFLPSGSIFSSASFGFRIVSRELRRLTFRGGKVRLRLVSGEGGRRIEGRCFSREKLLSFVSCLGRDGAPVRRAPVSFRKREALKSMGVCKRMYVRFASSAARGVTDCMGGVPAARTKARRTKFGAKVAETFGRQKGGLGVVGRGSGRFRNSSLERNVATVIEVGLAGPMFRNRAGAGLKGGRTCAVVGSLSCDGFYRQVRSGGRITAVVVGGTLSTTSEERGVGGVGRTRGGGVNGKATPLTKGMTIYALGGGSFVRFVMIRKSDTKNSTGRTESEEFRAVVPSGKGVVGARGRGVRGMLTSRRLEVFGATVKAKALSGCGRRSLGCGGVVVVDSTSISKFRVEAL